MAPPLSSSLCLISSSLSFSSSRITPLSDLLPPSPLFIPLLSQPLISFPPVLLSSYITLSLPSRFFFNISIPKSPSSTPLPSFPHLSSFFITLLSLPFLFTALSHLILPVTFLHSSLPLSLLWHYHPPSPPLSSLSQSQASPLYISLLPFCAFFSITIFAPSLCVCLLSLSLSPSFLFHLIFLSALSVFGKMK